VSNFGGVATDRSKRARFQALAANFAAAALTPAWLLYAAWSAARGPKPLGMMPARVLETGLILAIGFLFPSAPAAKVTAGWKVHPAVTSSRFDLRARTARGLDR